MIFFKNGPPQSGAKKLVALPPPTVNNDRSLIVLVKFFEGRVPLQCIKIYPDNCFIDWAAFSRTSIDSSNKNELLHLVGRTAEYYFLTYEEFSF